MKASLREIFDMDKTTRIGTITVVVVLVLVCCLYLFWPKSSSVSTQKDTEAIQEFASQIDSLQSAKQAQAKEKKPKTKKTKKKQPKKEYPDKKLEPIPSF